MTNVCIHEYCPKFKNYYFYTKIQIYMDVNAFKKLRSTSALDGIHLTKQSPLYLTWSSLALLNGEKTFSKQIFHLILKEISEMEN